MKKINKVVIPIAGFGSRMFPATLEITKAMLPIVDRPVIEYFIEECLEAGINEIIIVMSPNQLDVRSYLEQKNELALEKFKNKPEVIRLKELLSKVKISYVIQYEQKGLGHAISLTSDLVGKEDFGVILGDNPILSRNGEDVGMKQLVNAYNKENAYYIGVTEVSLDQSRSFGMVSSKDTSGENFLMDGMIEKPSSNPPSLYAAMGRYILGNSVYDYLKETKPGALGEIQITDAIRVAIDKERVFATKLNGSIHDTGNRLGFIKANIEYAMHREDIKEEVLKFIDEIK